MYETNDFPAKTKMKNLKNRKLYLQVYDEIKMYIVSNRLKAGDKLPTEMEMCTILGVSRNVLREAIKSLEITGVVSSKPGVGIIIQEFNTDHLFNSLFYSLADGSAEMQTQTMEVRKVLELGFAQAAFDRLTEASLQTMRELVNHMYEMLRKRGNSPESRFGTKFAEADALFHKTLFSNVDNIILSSIIDAFWACDKFYTINISRQYFKLTVYKHKIILDAAAARDFDTFQKAMDFHYSVHYKPEDALLLPISGDIELLLQSMEDMVT